MGIAMSIFLALGAIAIPLTVKRLRVCNHRFGAPVSGFVRCMKCTRRFRIETAPSGEWRIARQPEPDQTFHYLR